MRRLLACSALLVALVPITPSGAAVEAPRPAVTDLHVSPIAFRAARSGPSVKSSRAGTRVTYALGVPASVRFVDEWLRGGRSVDGSCAVPSAENRSAPLCERWVTLPGSFTRARQAGSDSFTFTGRIGGRALAPGVHRLIAKATGADGVVGPPRKVRFRIAH